MASVLNGIKVPHFKNTHDYTTENLPTPKQVKIVMSQHIGKDCDPTVAVGDHVNIGQVIGDSDALFSAPIHASVSGTVTAISTFIMPNGKKTQAVVIDSDEEQTLDPNIKPPAVNDFNSFIAATRNSGLVGLGGAGFPTHVKFSPKNLDEVHTLIINGAECEPYITSDYQTMIEDSKEDLFHGIQAVMKYLNLSKCIIAVEDNKPKAIKKLENIAKNYPDVSIVSLPAVYPQGAEKVLIYNTMNGLVIPEGKLPADVGVIVSNVTTIAVLGQYLRDGVPLVGKRVTVEGGAVANKKNVYAPLGASIKNIVDFCGGYKEEPKKILLGGPMMGISTVDDSFPLLKNNNALLALNAKETEINVETPCIRCGACVRACPMNLMPFLMKTYTEHEDVAELEKLKVNLCIECGCCSYVCPARQELVPAHKRGKQLLNNSKKAN